MKDLTTIGRTSTANFPEEGISGVPVKIDTGAHSSSIWASELHIDDDNTLHFVLFGVGSPFYSGKVHSTKAYKVRLVRSSIFQRVGALSKPGWLSCLAAALSMTGMRFYHVEQIACMEKHGT